MKTNCFAICFALPCFALLCFALLCFAATPRAWRTEQTAFTSFAIFEQHLLRRLTGDERLLRLLEQREQKLDVADRNTAMFYLRPSPRRDRRAVKDYQLIENADFVK